VRYFAINRARKAKKAEKKRKIDPLAFLTDSEDEDGDNYENFLCGGEITDDYMG